MGQDTKPQQQQQQIMSNTKHSFMPRIKANKCGKCQNHDADVSKKGHARNCPHKNCPCPRCRLLDARSDILQVISGKATKLKGTKKDPNCGFCQNHGVMILRKGHVRSCGFGQECHFKSDKCFDCEVHYIRNEVNRLQIKMRRAMREDQGLSPEERNMAREPITSEDVERVCRMACDAREKRERMSAEQGASVPAVKSSKSQQHRSSAASSSSRQSRHSAPLGNELVASTSASAMQMKGESFAMVDNRLHGEEAKIRLRHRVGGSHRQKATSTSQVSGGVWRPWSHHQQQMAAAAAMVAKQQRHQQLQPPQLNVQPHFIAANTLQIVPSPNNNFDLFGGHSSHHDALVHQLQQPIDLQYQARLELCAQQRQQQQFRPRSLLHATLEREEVVCEPSQSRQQSEAEYEPSNIIDDECMIDERISNSEQVSPVQVGGVCPQQAISLLDHSSTHHNDEMHNNEALALEQQHQSNVIHQSTFEDVVQTNNNNLMLAAAQQVPEQAVIQRSLQEHQFLYTLFGLLIERLRQQQRQQQEQT